MSCAISGSVRSADEHVARGAIQARAVAFRAGLHAEILRQLLAHRHRFGLAIAALEVRQDAFERVLLARSVPRLPSVYRNSISSSPLP